MKKNKNQAKKVIFETHFTEKKQKCNRFRVIVFGTKNRRKKISDRQKKTSDRNTIQFFFLNIVINNS